ncbi:hypothetical protein Poli38472_006948 [Pythium oligandrum]|uniref:Uncharacterized protein n=1 Tax=Pythium oligandrum TaxID=41045 RepID=A0A8K1C9B8_PYTOL|nr:hypothetical protein Poli38472_006948 [Pythium oligandrum]|eukprot:TMW58803.1 hypothetical protein Poli38472_006948 [Pythium oligandrum]
MSRSAGRLVLMLVLVAVFMLSVCVSASTEMRPSGARVTSLRRVEAVTVFSEDSITTTEEETTSSLVEEETESASSTTHEEETAASTTHETEETARPKKKKETTHVEEESSASTEADEDVSGGNASTKTEGEDAKETSHAKGPSTASFTGPLIAGVVAIVLIGAVVAFKNRPSNQ